MKNMISNILYFHPQNWTKKESQGNYNSIDPCNFLPQNEKGRKTEHLLVEGLECEAKI